MEVNSDGVEFSRYKCPAGALVQDNIEMFVNGVTNLKIAKPRCWMTLYHRCCSGGRSATFESLSSQQLDFEFCSPGWNLAFRHQPPKKVTLQYDPICLWIKPNDGHSGSEQHHGSDLALTPEP